ncbi:MAG: TIGR04283 family arsenosugar biosynthesis glycosyltransferase [Gammaproteobacteria bacterium]|nr:TIGR04283 family arsenosugar biosynthesis glycosyltransferase [Gammaproteobacteria bacterium]
MKLSIIIPALNEADNILATLLSLQKLHYCEHEIILVDGGSRDKTIELSQPLVDKIIHADRGRSLQMNTGAQQATGDALWFVHADTLVPNNADQLIANALNHKKYWGRFDVNLSGRQLLFRIIERMINIRSCITGIATGDQGIFVDIRAFNQLTGYAAIALMEDIELSSRLKNNYGRPACISSKLMTSSRRWQEHGILRTILLMWRLRLAYFLGVHPDTLAKRYSND